MDLPTPSQHFEYHAYGDPHAPNSGLSQADIGIDRYAVKVFQWMSPIHLKSQNHPLSRYIEQGLFVGQGVALFQQVGEGRAR